VLTKSAAATVLVTVALLLVIVADPAQAQGLASQQRLCDPEYQDCRADILTYIAQETVEIDMGFWLMDDAEYSNALVAAWQRGVKIRLLMDPRCTTEHPACASVNSQLSQAGLPMRKSIESGILHWKVALFAGQGQIEFSGANYSPFEMVPATPYQNYTDEIVMYTNDPSIVRTFMTKFDDLWTSTTAFANYANVSGSLTRSYQTFPEDPQLNFPPDQSYRSRAIAAYDAENVAIDVAMFRITDEQESNAMIAAVTRGIPVRLYTDETEYRNPARLWDAYNVDKMYHAGVTIRMDGHQGINHEKLVILRGQAMTIFGSSNWTSPSTDSQREHNMFTTQSWIFTWAQNQFNRKWTNGSGFGESKAFTPLPPDAPVYNLPADGATGVAPSGASLSWNGGLWGQLYDIYLGASPDPPLVAQDQKLGPSQSPTDYRTYALPPLQPGTTYYWKVVSKTMAEVAAPAPVWSFTTAGTRQGDDIDGDHRADLVIWRPTNGTYYWLTSSTGYNAAAAGSKAWGAQGDVPFVGDIDGDGMADLIIWRASNGTWYWLTSSSGYSYAAQGSKQWGAASQEDVPMLGDIDGDGKVDLVVWRASTGTFFWLTSSTGYNYANQGEARWGDQSLGDVPFLADFDGDGKADLTVWRASTGVWFWLKSTSNYTTSGQVQWGSQSAGDVPLVADMDGDGKADVIVWRAPTGMWFWLTSSSGYTTQVNARWGNQSLGDVPLVADFDGDGRGDIAVWRASTGTWFWLTSSSGFAGGGSVQWGAQSQGDVPIVK